MAGAVDGSLPTTSALKVIAVSCVHVQGDRQVAEVVLLEQEPEPLQKPPFARVVAEGGVH